MQIYMGMSYSTLSNSHGSKVSSSRLYQLDDHYCKKRIRSGDHSDALYSFPQEMILHSLFPDAPNFLEFQRILPLFWMMMGDTTSFNRAISFFRQRFSDVHSLRFGRNQSK